MHILGKILAFLVIVAAVVAGIFTAKAVTVRNSYMSKIQAAKTKTTTTAAEVAKLESKIDRLNAELFRSRDLWGAAWNNVNTNVNEDGSVVVAIGANNGVRQDLVMHGFELSPDGATSIYRGSFTPDEVRNDSARLRPNWRASKEEIQTWNPQGVWRWRNALPSGHEENFDRQLLAIVKQVETIGDRRRTLEGQRQRLEDAENALKMREAELLGGELLGDAKNVESEFRIGLVAAAEEVEEQRNKVLEEVDELRRKVRAVQADIEQLQKENSGLVRKLPGANSRDALTQKP